MVLRDVERKPNVFVARYEGLHVPSESSSLESNRDCDTPGWLDILENNTVSLRLMPSEFERLEIPRTHNAHVAAVDVHLDLRVAVWDLNGEPPL